MSVHIPSSAARMALGAVIAAGASALGIGAVPPAHAADLATEVGKAVPLSEVVAAAHEQVEGKVYAVELQPPAERYAVHMVDADGHRWRLEFESASGEMIQAVRLQPRAEKEAHRPAAFFGRRTPAGYPEW